MHKLVHIPPGYNPFDQPVLFTVPFNSTVAEIVPLRIGAIEAWNQYSVRICINYASQLGASVTLLAIMMFTTRIGKMTSATHILNVSCLFLNILRTLFLMLYFIGSWNEFYINFSHDYSQVTQADFNLSYVSNVWTTLEEFTLIGSLSLQTYAVFAATATKWKIVVATLLVFLGLLLAGFRVALMILNNIAISQATSFRKYKWLAADEQYILTACIFCFSAAFVGKLAHIIWRRRKLGIKHFSPMQILFIVGFQTMTIPAIFSVLQFYTQVPELGSQMLTITVLLLPLSTLWANSCQHNYESHGSASASSRTSWLSKLLQTQETGVTRNSKTSLESTGSQVPLKSASETHPAPKI